MTEHTKDRQPMFMHRRAMLRGLSLILAGASTVSCVGGSAEPFRKFYLRPPELLPDDLPKVDWSLVVEPPQTIPALRTTRIALAFAPNEFDYYADAEWGDLATVMVQGIIIRSFQNSGAIDVVANERQRLRPDFALKSSLLPFFAEGQEGEAPVAQVGLDVQLMQMRGREIVGTRSIEQSAKAEGPEMDAIIAAFDEALGAVLGELIPWTLDTGNAV